MATMETCNLPTYAVLLFSNYYVFLQRLPMSILRWRESIGPS